MYDTSFLWFLYHLLGLNITSDTDELVAAVAGIVP